MSQFVNLPMSQFVNLSIYHYYFAVALTTLYILVGGDDFFQVEDALRGYRYMILFYIGE